MINWLQHRSVQASRFLMLATIFCLSSLANADETVISNKKIERIETYIERSMKALNLPGLAVGIIEKGEPRLLKGYGVSDRAGTPMTADTSVELGSVSKSFTALAVMQLASQGKLDIERPVIDYIPWFRTQNKLQSDQILLRHLLNHRSGFSSLDGNRNLTSQDNSADAIKKVVEDLKESRLLFQPGTQFEYSNINYQTLAYLIELVEGKPYEAAIEDIIFKPLSMTNSFAQTPASNSVTVAEGFYYDFGKVKLSQVEQGRLTIAQGRLHVSATDMLIYLNQYMFGNDDFVSAKTKQMMFAMPDENENFGYGFGFFVSKRGDHLLAYHMGRSFGFETVILLAPERNFAMVALANAHSGFGNHNVGGLLRGIGDILLDENPAVAESPLVEKLLFWSMFVVPLLIIILALNFIRHYRQGNHFLASKGSRKVKIITRLILPSIVLLGIVYLVLVFLPEMHSVPLEVVALSEPTLFSGMIFCSSVAALWWLIRSFLIFKQALAQQLLREV